MPVEFGLYLPQIRMEFSTIEARARAAEAAGFSSVWFMDHLRPPFLPTHDSFEGWTTATAVAMRTERIRVGHLVLCDQFRHPALLAKMAATLDVISGGRLDLGIGWGSVPEELVAYGFGEASSAQRAKRLRETLEVLKLLFTGEPVDYDGQYFQLRGALGRPTPVRGGVPIHIGGKGRQLTMPLVAEYADWWSCPFSGFAELDELRPLAGGARVSVQHPVGLAANAQEREEVVAIARRRFGSWGGFVAGTPDEVVAALVPEAQAGVELFVVQFSDFGRPETLELFAREVMPAVREAKLG